jgi:hypothetical protein
MQSSLLQITLFIALMLGLIAFTLSYTPVEPAVQETPMPPELHISPDPILEKFEERGYDGRYAFYADLQIPSNEYRFFVLDLHTRQIVDRGLTLHGREDEQGKPLYSNVPDSNTSSRGMYQVSYRYKGSFGKAFKLKGLDETNSNAFKRAIVLHAWYGVPDKPTGSYMINSQGCPTVSPNFLDRLEAYIQQNGQAVLLYMN